MHEDHTTRTDSLVYEAAGSGKVNEQVSVVHILDANAEVADARSRVVRRDGLGAN